MYVINYLQSQDETKDYFNLNIKLFNACVGKESDSKIITIADQIVYFQIPHKEKSVGSLNYKRRMQLWIVRTVDDESIHIKPQLFLKPTFLV